MKKIFGLVLMSAFSPAAFGHGEAESNVVPAYRLPIVTVPGKDVVGVIVNFAPGGKSEGHSHGQAFVVAYVLEGSVRSQVDNEPIKVFHAGESWSERPGAHHAVSENASKDQPTKLFAVLVVDKDQKELVLKDK